MSIEVMPDLMTHEELADLAEAVRLLESRGFASRLTGIFGSQVEAIGRALPASARAAVAGLTENALKVALRVAIGSLDSKPGAKASNRLHKAAAAASGAIGGAFGVGALAVELPISTTILLRSIAEIAREQGEDLARPEASLACFEVFALGGHAREDAAIEGGYLAVRAALARSVSESARFILQQGVAGETAPVVVRLISQVAARFGVSVSQKLAAQAMPIFGAVGGAAVNTVFADHFQTMARGHFIVRQLRANPRRGRGGFRISASTQRGVRERLASRAASSPAAPPIPDSFAVFRDYFKGLRGEKFRVDPLLLTSPVSCEEVPYAASVTFSVASLSDNSSVMTVKTGSWWRPKDVIMATSAASRPREMRILPIRGWLWRASNVYQRPPR